ncbi:uncharacterized protein LOC133926285 isoform X2 [Phragmites australis]|uniref:uncharacterized protein LOC133926285 isoform X2 n=1 Tax=Phragmites australis TaxID=29695 RepID=UPI002D77615A|nr:uncharacterized protein LOC133926285 isoform X2 [Phragmites australis]
MSFWFVVRRSQISSALLFSYNTALGPPYRVIVDTNFSIQNELNLEKGMMDCLYAKCTPCITYCVMAQLEKLGQKYRVALRIAKDPRFHRLACTHKGTYAYDCIVERVTQAKCLFWRTLHSGLLTLQGAYLACGHHYKEHTPKQIIILA